MAACSTRALRLFQGQSKKLFLKRDFVRSFSGGKKQEWDWGRIRTACLAAVGTGVAVYAGSNWYSKKGPVVHALKGRKNKEEEVKAIKLTSRERRFLRFASVEYDGQLYMTPQDFLESVVEAEPRPRLKRKSLTKQDLQNIKDSTPNLQKGSAQMFRNLRDKGIISYTEYLFLLSILTKPQTGFRIAFNMFDTDGNQKVDKNEFLVLLHLISIHIYRQESVVQNMQAYVRNLVETVENTLTSDITLPSSEKVLL